MLVSFCLVRRINLLYLVLCCWWWRWRWRWLNQEESKYNQSWILLTFSNNLFTFDYFWLCDEKERWIISVFTNMKVSCRFVKWFSRIFLENSQYKISYKIIKILCNLIQIFWNAWSCESFTVSPLSLPTKASLFQSNS